MQKHTHSPRTYQKTKHKDSHTEDNKQQKINATKILEIWKTEIAILHFKRNLMLVHTASQLHWPYMPFSSTYIRLSKGCFHLLITFSLI